MRSARTEGCGSSVSNKCWKKKMLFVLQSGGLTTLLAPSLACITSGAIKRMGKAGCSEPIVNAVSVGFHSVVCSPLFKISH